VEELDGDLWGYFPDRLLNFVGGIGQAVRVDVDANATTRTLHVFTRFQTPDALFKFMAAVRTLKFDDVGIDIWHRASFVLFCGLGDRAGIADLPAPNSTFRQEGVFSVPHTKHRCGRKEALFSDYKAEPLMPTM